MRITVLDFDTGDDTAAALAAINAALCRRTNGLVVPDSRRLVTSEQGRGLPTVGAAPVEQEELSAPLLETWQYLVAQDRPEGITGGQLAGGLHIKPPTAQWRLNKLIDKGMAHRVRTGYYRAGEGA